MILQVVAELQVYWLEAEKNNGIPRKGTDFFLLNLAAAGAFSAVQLFESVRLYWFPTIYDGFLYTIQTVIFLAGFVEPSTGFGSS